GRTPVLTRPRSPHALARGAAPPTPQHHLAGPRARFHEASAPRSPRRGPAPPLLSRHTSARHPPQRHRAETPPALPRPGPAPPPVGLGAIDRSIPPRPTAPGARRRYGGWVRRARRLHRGGRCRGTAIRPALAPRPSGPPSDPVRRSAPAAPGRP